MMKSKAGKIFEELREQNGSVFVILAIIVCIAIPLKLLLFYRMMGVTANFFAVWGVTTALVYLIFASFRNKWIPAVLFFVFSFLMFADAAYASFFNRYLSINMLGAAGELGGVQESVREVLKAKYFLLMADAVVVFIALAAAKFHQHKINRDNDGPGPAIARPDEDSTAEDNEESNLIMDDAASEVKDGCCTIEESDVSEKKSTVMVKAATLKTIGNKIIHPVIAILIISMMFTGASGSYIIASAANQEFFSYHIKDVTRMFSDTDELYVDPDDLFISTGTYENEIDGPLFGIAEGRNLIVIQVESMQNFVVGQDYNGYEITPNLNRLITDNSIYFNNYYEQRGSGNTSDAEFATNNSLYGTITSYTYNLYSENYFHGLPWILKDQGYSTAAFHGYEKDFWNRDAAYPGQGFDSFYSELDFKPTRITGMGIDDTEFFEQSIDYMKGMQEPFYGFLVTLSNHYPFVMPDEYIKIPIQDDDKGTIFGNYINSVNHTDQAIGLFIQKLKESGLYDNSIIAIYGDHFALTPNEPEIFDRVSNYLGKDYDFDNMMNVPFLIHIPGSGLKETVSISGGHMDFLPTISYLLGLEQLDTLYFGHNLLTADSGFVAEQAYMTKGSFIQDDVIFEMSRDGVFENSRAWNTRTGKTVPLSECKSGYLKSKLIIDSSEFYLKNDVLKKVLLDNIADDELFNEEQIINAPSEIVVAGAQDAALAGTNSLEALNASYMSGSRYIKIELSWSSEGATYMEAASGYSSLTFSDLAEWMEEHVDAFLILETDKDIAYVLNGIDAKYPELKRRIIPEVTSMDDFSRVSYIGYRSALFSVGENCGYTERQLNDFIELNPVWAVSVPSGMISHEFNDMIRNGRSIYSRSESGYKLELE